MIKGFDSLFAYLESFFQFPKPYLSSGQAGEVTLLRSNTEESWSFQDNLIVHYPSGKVLTAYEDGSLHLAPRHSASRTSLPELIFSRTAAVLDKLLTLIDFVKVRSV